MERLMSARLPVWALILLVMAGLLGLVGYAHVLKSELAAPGRYGVAGTAAVDLAKVPTTLRDLLRNEDRMEAKRAQRHDGKSGWTVTIPAAGPQEGYLLLSRYSGDVRRSVVELVDLSDMSVRHSWEPDADSLLGDVPLDSAITDGSRWNTEFFRSVHPLLLEDGSIILKDHETPLMRLDACARLVWSEQTDVYHHSTNLGPEGTLWVPARIEPSDVAATDQFNDDALAEVDLEGRRVRSLSLARIYDDNGLRAQIFGAGAFQADPFHLNDIEPVMADGPHWRRGDLFLSMRNQSTVLLFRPSTGRIVWMRQGPWMGQHDVDIIDDHTIAVFDNRAYDVGKGIYVDGANDISFYDFDTDRLTSPFEEAMRAADIVTSTEGLFDLTATGRLMVEEENSGRIVIFDAGGAVAAEYVNRAGNGHVYRLGWSRWIARDLGDKALAAARNLSCGA